MKKYKETVNKYSELGVSLENIEYAIDAINYGTKRALIIEGLTADYRGMRPDVANAMLNDLYNANGGEFKKENRRGYLYAAFFLLTGLCCACIVYITNKEAKALFYDQLSRVNNYNTPIYYKNSTPWIVSMYAYAGTAIGIFFLVKTLFGKYRDSHQPF